MSKLDFNLENKQNHMSKEQNLKSELLIYLESILNIS